MIKSACECSRRMAAGGNINFAKEFTALPRKMMICNHRKTFESYPNLLRFYNEKFVYTPSFVGRVFAEIYRSTYMR